MNNCVTSDITAVILARGQSRRFGRDKALEPIGGEPMIRRVIQRAANGINASDVVLVASSPERGAGLPLDPPHRVVADVFPGCGPLGGIYSGLRAARTE